MCQTIIVELNSQAQTEHGVDQSTQEKAMRWLGFVQCQLWNDGFYTIDQMREHNR